MTLQEILFALMHLTAGLILWEGFKAILKSLGMGFRGIIPNLVLSLIVLAVVRFLLIRLGVNI
mgnify:CR=1 FL=1